MKRDLQTQNYHLMWANGQGRGTFIIERVADGFTTLRDTGVEAIEHYEMLLRRYNISGASFDAECACYHYTE